MAESKISEALTILKTAGWRGVALSGDDPFPRCMHLAVWDAYDRKTTDAMIADVRALASVCQEQYPELAQVGSTDLLGSQINTIWAVNDTPGRTFDEIERIMEKAYLSRCSEIVD